MAKVWIDWEKYEKEREAIVDRKYIIALLEKIAAQQDK